MKNERVRPAPKQKRGQERVELILNAASELLAELGYEAATITAIAARANTSVGSLYQFFANKEAILYALVERYVERASIVFAGMQVEAFPEMTLEESIKAMLFPLKAFIQDNRDFQVILSSSISSAFLAETIRAMDEAFLARIDAMIASARPTLNPETRRKYELVCMMIMKALLGLAVPSADPVRGLTLDEVFEEMEAVFLLYLTPVMG